MELENDERSILSYFPSSTKAQAAVDELRAQGITEVQLDRVSRYGTTNDRQQNNPAAGQGESNTGLTLYSADYDRFSNNDARTLLGADPSVSGIASEGYGLAGGQAFMVTVVTTPEQVQQAVKILEAHGGMV